MVTDVLIAGKHDKHVLYGGTEVLQTRYYAGKRVKVLVFINTLNFFKKMDLKEPFTFYTLIFLKTAKGNSKEAAKMEEKKNETQ